VDRDVLQDRLIFHILKGNRLQQDLPLGPPVGEVAVAVLHVPFYVQNLEHPLNSDLGRLNDPPGLAESVDRGIEGSQVGREHHDVTDTEGTGKRMYGANVDDQRRADGHDPVHHPGVEGL